MHKSRSAYAARIAARGIATERKQMALERPDKRMLARLIRRIGAASDAEREDATRALEQHGVRSADSILQLYHSSHLLLPSGHLLSTVAQNLLVASIFAGAIILARARHDPVWCACTGILAMACSLAVNAAACVRREQYTKGIGYLLARCSDRSALGPLLDVHAQYRDANRVIGRAIIRRLESLQPSDGHLLSRANRDHLYACLQEFSGGDGTAYGINAADFCRAILFALGQIGDIAAIPHVERTARSALDPCVRDAALQRLSALRALAQSIRSGNTLLRAARPEVHPDELLRWAEPGPAEKQWGLLRSTAPSSISAPGNGGPADARETADQFAGFPGPESQAPVIARVDGPTTDRPAGKMEIGAPASIATGGSPGEPADVLRASAGP